MKQILIRQGKVVVDDVPSPQVEPGTVLVQSLYSSISAGTEMSGIRSSGNPLWKRVLQQPSSLKRAWTAVQRDGFRATWETTQNRAALAQPMGYSVAGIVIEPGPGVTDLAAGDPVACAGAQCAFHAEWICVPRNLVVPIPDGLERDLASTVTLGAIALQGVRRAQPTLGESFVIIGLGILGQLAAQLLRANGCRVIGVDLDRTRIDLAKRLGMDHGAHPDDGDDVQQVAQLTDGLGADGVLITAATPSDAVVATAFRMCRKKGRVVLIGDVGLHLNRKDFYEKELDFLISTSYGPGRYDRRYEQEGLDYPVGYVRWTENRNMAEYLRLLAEKKLRIRDLIGACFPIQDAAKAYEKLSSPEGRPLIALLTYPAGNGTGPSATVECSKLVVGSTNRGTRVRLALVGAGGFAKGMHLPNIKALSRAVELRAVVSRTGHNALDVARQHSAAYATTDFARVLHDSRIDALLITTRHDTHARMALEALRAGKHVLVEKPLALSTEELAEISRFYQEPSETAKPMLLTGFNRRFSPFGGRIKEIVARRTNPMILNYRMNAGYLPPDHWVHGPEGGGRNLGEACHVYDLFTFLVESRAVDVSARSVTFRKSSHYRPSDNFVATMSFEDGSLATLTYTALGSSAYPKELLEIYVDGHILALNDYKCLTIHGRPGRSVSLTRQEKGQKEELSAFIDAILENREWPIPFWQQVQATEIALRVEQALTGIGS